MQSDRGVLEEDNGGLVEDNGDPYSGFIGLNTKAIAQRVILPKQLQEWFPGGTKYCGEFAYPGEVARGFDKAPEFWVEFNPNGSLSLHGHCTTNRQPKDCLIFFAGVLLAPEYIATDRLIPTTDAEHGFGPGTLRVTTHDCVRPNGKNAPLTKKLIAVEDRPALFLKIINRHGDFYDNICMFFPDHTGRSTHKSVQFGEAFILVRDKVLLDDEMLEDIAKDFKRLVKTELYPRDNDLLSTNDKMPIEQHDVSDSFEIQRPGR